MPDHENNEGQQGQTDQGGQQGQDEQMCCEGGMTAAEHRHQSEDGKCCTD
jgi:hypothetical protein